MSDKCSVSSDEVLIQAPAELVWQVLLDFPAYKDWNAFCPEIRGRAEVGSALEMQVDLGNGLQTQVETITRLEPCHTIVWSMENRPGDPIHADRTQRVTPVDEHSCRYWTVDEFSGAMARPMVEQLGAAVERGFNLCARGLKVHAESLYRQTQSSARDSGGGKQ